MSVTNATALRKNLYRTLEEVGEYSEIVTVHCKTGNVVLLSETDYNALMETVYLMSNPTFMKGFSEARAQDRSTYLAADLDEAW